jgi:hypothetical protein
MYRVSASNVQFRAGSSIRGTGGSIHPASQLIANPLYDYYTIDFDVAVARVSDFKTPCYCTKSVQIFQYTTIKTG